MEKSEKSCPADTLQSDVVAWCVAAKEVNQRMAR